MVFKFLACLVKAKNKYKVSACLLPWKLFLILKIVPKATSIDFSSVYIHGPAFGTVFSITGGFRNSFFRVTGGYRKAGTGFLKMITGRIFSSSKWVHRCSQKLYFVISEQKSCKKLWKLSELKQKVLFWILGPSHKLFILWHYPLNRNWPLQSKNLKKESNLILCVNLKRLVAKSIARPHVTCSSSTLGSNQDIYHK